MHDACKRNEAATKDSRNIRTQLDCRKTVKVSTAVCDCLASVMCRSKIVLKSHGHHLPSPSHEKGYLQYSHWLRGWMEWQMWQIRHAHQSRVENDIEGDDISILNQSTEKHVGNNQWSWSRLRAR
jgi:hypothetical protein